VGIIAEQVDIVKNFSRDVKLFTIGRMIGSFGSGMASVVFNLFFIALGYTKDMLGLYLSTSTFAMAFIALIAGGIASRFSAKTIIISSSSINAISLFLQYMFPIPVVLFSGNLIIGISSSFAGVASSPYITEVSVKENRDHVFSYIRAASVGAVFVGNLLGGFMPYFFGNILLIPPNSWQAYQATLLFSQIFIFSALIPLSRLRRIQPAVNKESLFEQFTFKNITHKGFIIKYGIPVWLVGLGAGLFVRFMNVWFKDVFAAETYVIGMLFSANTLFLTIGFLLAPIISKRIGKIHTIVYSQALSIPMMIGLGLAPTIQIAAIFFVSRATLMNMVHPVSTSFFMETINREEREMANGIVNSGDSLVRGIAATIGGWMMSQNMYREQFFIASILYVLSISTFYSFFRKYEEKES